MSGCFRAGGEVVGNRTFDGGDGAVLGDGQVVGGFRPNGGELQEAFVEVVG